MIKFRIKEIKESHFKSKYFPQYKDGLFWHNIANHKFESTIFNNVNFNYDGSVWYKNDADKSIEEFKEYLKSSSEYVIIHNID